MLCAMADHAELTSSEAADHVAIRELFDGYARCAVRRDAEGRSPGTSTVAGASPKAISSSTGARPDPCTR
jgi:hypothetical protein